MDRDSAFSVREIVSVAVAAASALGGVIVALGRSQANAVSERVAQLDVSPARHTAAEQLTHGREVARSAATLLTEAYPEMRGATLQVVDRASTASKPLLERIEQIRQREVDHLRRQRAASHGIVQRSEQARVVAGHLRGAIPSRRPRLSGIVHVPEAVTTRVSDAAVASSGATKDILASVSWLTASGLVAYFAFCDTDRRHQIRSSLVRALVQTKQLVRDFQGYEDDV